MCMIPCIIDWYQRSFLEVVEVIMIKIVSEYKKQYGNSNQFLQTGLIQMTTGGLGVKISFICHPILAICSRGWVLCAPKVLLYVLPIDLKYVLIVDYPSDRACTFFFWFGPINPSVFRYLPKYKEIIQLMKSLYTLETINNVHCRLSNENGMVKVKLKLQLEH